MTDDELKKRFCAIWRHKALEMGVLQYIEHQVDIIAEAAVCLAREVEERVRAEKPAAPTPPTPEPTINLRTGWVQQTIERIRREIEELPADLRERMRAEVRMRFPDRPPAAPTPSVGMSREDATGIANHFAGRQDGLPPEWVVRAIQHAYALGREEARDG